MLTLVTLRIDLVWWLCKLFEQAEELAVALAASKGLPGQGDNDVVSFIVSTLSSLLNCLPCDFTLLVDIVRKELLVYNNW